MVFLRYFGLGVLSILLALALKDFYIFLIWFRKYRSQGIKFEYVPFLGMHYYLITALHPFFEKSGSLKKYMPNFYSGKDAGAKFKQLEEKRRGEDVVAFNHIETNPSLLVLKPELIHEAMIKDNDVMKRHIPLELPIGAGFMEKNGAKGLHQRGIFAKFFKFEQLMALTPKIVAIIQKNLDSIKKNFPNLKNEYPENFKSAGKFLSFFSNFRTEFTPHRWL